MSLSIPTPMPSLRVRPTPYILRSFSSSHAALYSTIRTPRHLYQYSHLQQSPQQHRKLTTSASYSVSSPSSSNPNAPPRARPAQNPDRGPASTEDTQTDFNALNVLGNTASPTTSVDICLDDGFMLDSGLRVQDGDGVVLVGGAGFVWRPWMSVAGGAGEGGVVTGLNIRGKGGLGRGTGGVINKRGQFELGEAAWGLLRGVWPRPDLIIIGTGASIRPLAPETRQAVQQLGLRIEVLDTRNAASQFNLLATERGPMEVCAALVPIGFGT